MNQKKKQLCVIMQPTYLPWIGYFDLIKQSDIFVFLNDVQFSKQSWQVKNRIKNQGEELMLTIPVKKSKLLTNLDSILIDNSKPWKKKHLKSIYYSYKRTQFFEEVYPFIEKIILKRSNFLSEFNMQIIQTISKRIFGFKEFIDSRGLNLNSNDKIDRIIKICKKVGSEEYLSPDGALTYLKSLNYQKEFYESSIGIKFHNYKPIKYSQLNEPFLPYLSILDLLFNMGFDQSKKII